MVESIYLEKMAVPTVPIWRLSVEQYHEMIRTGILTENDPVELLEGLLVPKMTKNPSHSNVTRSTRLVLSHIIPSKWLVDSQEPITIGDSEPEPDIIVILNDLTRYANRHPGPADIALVIEVADSTLQFDQTTKKRIYARAGIPIYWIMNLVDKQIEVYSEPAGATDPPDYRQQQIYTRDQSVPLILDGHEIAQIPVRDLLA